MSDPNETGDVGVTLKFSESSRYKGDNPWITFRGSPERIKENILAVMGMTDEENLPLVSVVANAQREATALSNAMHGLGGKVISEGGSPAWAEARGEKAQKTDEEKAAEKLAGLVAELIVEIDKATTVDQVKEVWARNQDAFKDETLMAHWKAKGLKIQEAAPA